jgi:serine protease Do
MPYSLRRLVIGAVAVAAILVGDARGQGPPATPPETGLEAAVALEKALVESIARAERSVVAISRVRKDKPGEVAALEVRPNGLGGSRLTSRGGLILTAYHALGEDSEYYLWTYDHKVFRAKIVGADPRSDLAILAPDDNSPARRVAMEWTPITFGDPARLRKGQLVISLGNPFAIARDGQASASWGIVANLARKAPVLPDEVDSAGRATKTTVHHFGTLIQTDAKLNQGTSGGPLLNLKGEMIGMTTSIPAVPGYEESAGYAIPVDATFRRAVDLLKQGREVEYGFLGIRLKRLTPAEMLQGVAGARVESILPGMPAERSEIRPNDIIAAVNGVSVRDSDSLFIELAKFPIDVPVKIGLVRAGQRREIDLEMTKLRVRGKKVVTVADPDWRGLRVDYLTAVFDLQSPGVQRLPISEAVAIVDVAKDTPAWNAGLRPGMLISHVERTSVRTPKEFRQAIAARNGPVSLRVADRGDRPARVLQVPGA